MDKSGEEVKASIMEAFIHYFNNGGQTLSNSQDFLLVWGKHVEDNTVNTSMMPSLNINPALLEPGSGGPLISLNPDMTDVELGQEIIQGTNGLEEDASLEEIENSDVANENQNDDGQESDNHMMERSATLKNFEDVNEDDKSVASSKSTEYQGETNCEQCELSFYNCSTHNHHSLLNKYGPGMVCVGENCGKSLYHCLNEVHKDVRGAFICKNCKEEKCRQMKCNVCHFKGNDTGRGRRTRRTGV